MNYLRYQDRDGVVKVMSFPHGEFNPPHGLPYISINEEEYKRLKREFMNNPNPLGLTLTLT